MNPAYLAQRDAINRICDTWEATLQGFLSAEYAPTPPGHWYMNDPELRAAFEKGHAKGLSLLKSLLKEPS